MVEREKETGKVGVEKQVRAVRPASPGEDLREDPHKDAGNSAGPV